MTEYMEPEIFRKIVYVCSPYSGDTEANAERARRFCRYVLEKKYIPYAPHLLFPQYMDEWSERRLALSAGLRMLDVCDELWVFGNKITPGMAGEIRYAQDHGIEIRYIKGAELTVASFTLLPDERPRKCVPVEKGLPAAGEED